MARPKKQIRQSKIVDAFAERMRALRGSQGITQRELADRVNTGVTYITRLESGSVAPGIDLVERIADALKVHVSELLPAIQPLTENMLRDQIKVLLGTVLAKGGQETLSALKLVLVRFADSASISR